MTSRLTVVRNVVIIAAVAAAIAFVPGGGDGAGVVVTAISLGFMAALAWVAIIMYRERRTTLYSLEDNRRAAVYVAVGVLALTLTATSRMWHSAGASVAWLLLVGASIYVLVAVYIAARRY